ncbi:hypothetical protein [Intestinimonas sp. HCP28S3_D6]|uniref:hypothetical protein n=1 Tax=Intestinimonas sp. HCP28S3_D6 TaxID=3438942 RepID=UPI003F8AAB8E
METVERKAPKTTHFWNKKAPKALESSTFGAFEQLVRMRSPVQIWVAAPKNIRFSDEKRIFSLLFATILDDLNLRFYL